MKFEGGSSTQDENKKQEEGNKSQIDAMFGENNEPSASKENNLTDAQRSEANVNQIHAMFSEDRINPSAEGKEKTVKVESTSEDQNAQIKAELEKQADSQKEEYFSEKMKGVKSFEELEALNKEIGSVKSSFDNGKTTFDAEGMEARIDDIRSVYSKLGKEKFNEAVKNGGFLEYAKQHGLNDKIIELVGKELEGKASQENPKTEAASENTFDETKGMTPKEIENALKTNATVRPEAGKKVEANPTETKNVESSGKKSFNEVGRERMKSITESGRKLSEEINKKIEAIMQASRSKYENVRSSMRDNREWLKSKAKEMRAAIPSLGDIGYSTIGAMEVGGKKVGKGVEMAFGKAAEKMKQLDEKGKKAFENMSKKIKAAVNKFREYRNQKRLEKASEKTKNRIAGLNKKIADLQALKENLRVETIKASGKFVKYGEKIEKLKTEREEMGYQEETVPETGAEQSNVVIDMEEFRAKKQQEASNGEKFKEAV